jgi:hypothetical protein
MLTNRLVTAYEHTLRREAEEKNKPAQMRKELIEHLVKKIIDTLSTKQSEIQTVAAQKNTSYPVYEENIYIQNGTAFSIGSANVDIPSLYNSGIITKDKTLTGTAKDEATDFLVLLCEVLKDNENIKKLVEGCEFKRDISHSVDKQGITVSVKLLLDWSKPVNEINQDRVVDLKKYAFNAK